MDYRKRLALIPLRVLTVFIVGLLFARKFGGHDLAWAIVVVAAVCGWTGWAAWRGRTQEWSTTYRGRHFSIRDRLRAAAPLAVVAAILCAGAYLVTHRHARAAAAVLVVGACGYTGWMFWRGRSL